MDGERKFLEMELQWVRAIRKGKKIELVLPALDREEQILRRMEAIKAAMPQAAGFREAPTGEIDSGDAR